MVILQLFSLFLKLLDLLFEIRKLILERIFSFRGFTLGCLLLKLELILQSLLFRLELFRLVFSIVKLVLNSCKVLLLLLIVPTATLRTIISTTLRLTRANSVGRFMFVIRNIFVLRITRFPARF